MTECKQMQTLLGQYLAQHIAPFDCNVTLSEASNNDAQKNPEICDRVNGARAMKQQYTPTFMEKIKSYLFQDAIAYTEQQFERFVAETLQQKSITQIK